MNFRTAAFSIAIACSTLIGGASYAEAARGVVTQTVNIRTGPSVNHHVIGKFHAGTRVEIQQCTASQKWCYVSRHGKRGWINAKFLRSHHGGGGGGGYNHRPGGICFYGAHGYICLN